MLLGNFYCCKWPNIEQIVYPSGHTVLYHHHHELCNGCEREIRRRNRKTWMTSSSQFIYLEANLFLKKGPFSASFFFTFVLFTFQFKWQIYSLNNINWKKHRWCFGTRTRGGRMEGADESIELWRHPWEEIFFPPKLEESFLYLLSIKSDKNRERDWGL